MPPPLSASGPAPEAVAKRVFAGLSEDATLENDLLRNEALEWGRAINPSLTPVTVNEALHHEDKQAIGVSPLPGLAGTGFASCLPFGRPRRTTLHSTTQNYPLCPALSHRPAHAPKLR